MSKPPVDPRLTAATAMRIITAAPRKPLKPEVAAFMELYFPSPKALAS